MKKLLINLFLIAFISGFISATPGKPSIAKSTTKVSVEATNNVVVMEEIHPLYILEYRFK